MMQEYIYAPTGEIVMCEGALCDWANVVQTQGGTYFFAAYGQLVPAPKLEEVPQEAPKAGSRGMIETLEQMAEEQFVADVEGWKRAGGMTVDQALTYVSSYDLHYGSKGFWMEGLAADFNATAEPECKHSWKLYDSGWSRYDYCEHCNQKKDI